MTNPVGGWRVFFVSSLVLMLANAQQVSSLGVVVTGIQVPANPANGIPAMNLVMIQQVLPNSPAALAGLLPGDGIIKIDDSPVVSAGEVTQWVEKRSSRGRVTLTILRRDWFGQYVPMQVRILLPPGVTGSARPSAQASGGVKPGRPTAAWLGVKFNLKTQPVKVHFNDYHTCYAVGPADWVVWGHRKEGDAVDVGGPDGSTASWGSLGVTGFMRQSLSQATPETYIQWFLSNGGTGQNLRITYGEPIQDEFGYIWLPYVKEDSKPPTRGVYIYRVFPVPQDPMGYILISRIAQTPKQLWEQKGAVALTVGLSIRCSVQLHASPGSPKRPRSDDDKQESTYNQQLGTEYAHNPETGDIYWMNHASDWRENGPQGAGYYVHSGNEWKKLEPGLGR